MNHTIALAVAGIAVLGVAPTVAAQDLLAPDNVITITPGETISSALRHAALRRHAAELREAWRVGHGGITTDIPTTPPAITVADVVSGTLQVGTPTSVPVIQFGYKTSKAGLSGAQFVFVSPNGQDGVEMSYYAGPLTISGNVVFAGQNSAPYFAQPGNWTLQSASIADLAGNYTQYSAAQVAKIVENPVLTVVNTGPVDFTAPSVTGGRIDTPKVSLSAVYPQIKAALTATDDLSGVVAGYIFVQPPGAAFSYTTTSFSPFPFRSGSIEVAFPLKLASQTTGAWTIGGYALCDAAQNCYTTTSAGDVKRLFGTATFTVTK